MKNYKKVIVVSLIASSVAFTPVINSKVNASAMDHNLFKVGADRGDYQEIAGPHLIVRISAYDKQKKHSFEPRYLEFPLKPGNVLTKKDVINYIEWTLDSHDYKKYRIVELDPESKVQVSYFSKTEKQVVTEYFPVTEKGFIIPDLSEHVHNPGFSIVTNVVVEERNSK